MRFKLEGRIGSNLLNALLYADELIFNPVQGITMSATTTVPLSVFTVKFSSKRFSVSVDRLTTFSPVTHKNKTSQATQLLVFDAML